MSIAANALGELALAAHAQADTAHSVTPPKRTITAKADAGQPPEAR